MSRDEHNRRGARWWGAGAFGLLAATAALVYVLLSSQSVEALDGAMAVDCDATTTGVHGDIRLVITQFGNNCAAFK